MFEKLKPFAKKAKDIGEGLDHLGAASLLLYSIDPHAAITTAIVTTALAKALRGTAALINGLSTEETIRHSYFAEAERLENIRRLIIYEAYLGEISSELLKLPCRPFKLVSSTETFLLFLEEPEEESLRQTYSLDSFDKSERLFASYKARLGPFLIAVFGDSSEVPFLIDRIDKQARLKATFAIESNPQLSQPFVNNTLQGIAGKLNAIGDVILNTKKDSETSSDGSSKLSNLDQLTNCFETLQGEQKGIRSQIDEIHRHIFSKSLIDEAELKITKAITSKIKNLFDSARSELQDGSLSKATSHFNLVLELSEGLEDKEILELRARSISNIGIASYLNGKSAEAQSSFDLAYDTYPENENISALKALSLHLSGETQDAMVFLKSLLAKNPQSEAAVTTLSQILDSNDSPDLAVELLNSYPIKTEGWYDSYGRVLCNKREFESALIILNEGLQQFGDSTVLKIGKAVAITIPLTDGLLLRKAMRSKKEREHLALAENLFNQAAISLRNRDRCSELIEVLLNRSAILITLEKPKDAVQTLREIELLSPTDPRLLNLMVGANWAAGNLKEARECAEKIFQCEQSLESGGRLAAVLLASGFPEESLEIIEKLEAAEDRAKSDPSLQGEKLAALRCSHQRENADKFAAELADRFPEHSIALGNLAEFYEARKDFTKAEHFFTEAAKFAKSKQEKDCFQLTLGEFYYRQQKWKKVIEYLSCDFDIIESCQHLRELSHSHLELGDIETAAKIVRSATRENSPPDLLEIRAWVEHQLFEFEDCRKTLKILSRVSPNVSWSLKIADASNRLGQREVAYGILRDLFDQNPSNVDVAAMVSQACYMMRYNQEAFEIARNAYRIHPADKRLRYLLSRTIILSDGEVQLTREDVQLVQECVADNDVFTPVQIAEESGGSLDFTPLLDLIAEADYSKRQLMNRYHAMSAPLALLLPHITSDVWAAWKAMAYSSVGAIYMANGTKEDQEDQLRHVSSFDNIVVDFSAILTLAALGKLSLLFKKYKRIYTSSDTAFLFQNSIDYLEGLKKSEGSMVHENGRFYFIKQRKEEVEADLASVRKIIDFLKDERISAVGLAPHILKLWKENESLKNIPEIMFLPVGVALSVSLPIYTDQSILSKTARVLGAPGSFCTQAFLRTCAADKIISIEECEESVIQLASLNYEFTSVSRNTFIKALEIDAGIIGDATRVLLKKCSAERSKNESTARILGEAAAYVWYAPIKIFEQKHLIVTEFARAAGAFLPESNMMISFVAGFLSENPSMPSSVYGLIDMIASEAKVDWRKRFEINMLKERLGVSVVKEMRRVKNQWFPMCPDWYNNVLLQKAIAPLERLTEEQASSLWAERVELSRRQHKPSTGRKGRRR